MTEPQLDHPKRELPAQVRDIIAENGIKWSAIIQGLIFFSITSFAGVVAYFGDRFITGQDAQSITLIEIREEISAVGSTGKINSNGIKVLNKRVDRQDKRNDRQDNTIQQQDDKILKIEKNQSKVSDDINYFYSIIK